MSLLFGLFGVLLLIVIAPGLQAISRRAVPSVPPVIILALSVVVSHLASVLAGAATTPHFHYWNAAAVFGFGAMLYVFAFGAVYKSVSLEILLDLAQRPEHKAPLSDIVDRQVPDIFRKRTEILVGGGQVEHAGSSFVVTATGRKLADRISRIRRAFGIGDTGLYDFSAPAAAPDKTRDR
jgi:hypothetical protein